MSDALFIVTARSVFSPYVSERRISARYTIAEKTMLPRRAFLSLPDAQKWASENMPEILNPFQACFVDGDGEDGVTGLFLYSIEPQAESESLAERRLAMEELIGFVADLGMAPPRVTGDWKDGDRLRAWWDAQSGSMTDTARFALWRFLVPEPWCITLIDAEF